MAITVTRIGTDLNDTTDATSYTTAEFSFVSGRVYLLAVVADAGSNENLAHPTVSGATSGAWTVHGGASSFDSNATPTHRLGWRRHIAVATFSETLTIDYGLGNDQLECRAAMLELTGAHATTPGVQSDAGQADSGTAVSTAITLASFADATNNACLLAFGKVNAGAVAPAGSMLELTEVGSTSPALWVGYMIGENVNPSATWASSAAWGGVALEIQAAAGTATLTGTATNNITEADIVTGGKTILLTLTNDTWVTAGATFNNQRQNIINGCDSAQAEATGWDAEVKAKMAVTDVVRTSDTLVTITLPAEAAYNITAMETITVTIPSTAVALGAAIVASPTFTVVTAGGGVAATSATLRRYRRRR
jgi:hypothetical protein